MTTPASPLPEMPEMPETPEPLALPHGASHDTPRADLKASFVWMALGLAVLIGSLRMDRLESQDINPYTVPGLLPGLLGIVLILLGFLLMLRSWRRGMQPPEGVVAASGEEKKRVLLVMALCLVFGVLLVGHGLPFWAAAALFVSVAILSLQHAQRKAAGQSLTIKVFAKAIAIGIGAGVVIMLVFQELFLVHLP
jgi:hypothetical protein